MDGAKIKDLRTKRGISLTELAKRSGVSKSYLSFLERNMQQNPSIEVLEKIAKALDVNMYSLFIDETTCTSIKATHLDRETLELAIELDKANVDKEKLRMLIDLLK